MRVGYDYTGRGNGEVGDFMWCTCTVIATENVPNGPRSIYKEGEVHYPVYDVVHGYSARQCTMSARCLHYTSTQAVLVRWDADDRVEPPEVETESAFKLLKSRWSKSHSEGAWRLDLDHISRGRHRTGSVFKVPYVPPRSILPNPMELRHSLLFDKKMGPAHAWSDTHREES